MLRHFASSSDGIVVTLDGTNGDIVWNQDYNAPVVAMYSLDNEGLRKIPFLSMAAETLEHLTGQMAASEWKNKFLEQGDRQNF